MNNSYSLDVEVFISEVKKYPEIWNLNSEDNRFKNKKQHAWTEIARYFIADFDELPHHEKLEVCRKLHGKWRNIRDSYVRHLKRKYGKKGYVYAKHLHFLRELYKQNSQSESDDCDNDENSEEEEKGKGLQFKNRKFDLLNEPCVWTCDPDDSQLDNLKTKRTNPQSDIEFVDTPFPDTSMAGTYTAPPEDDDRSFFESLLPAVRKFNMDQKLEFRSQVLGLIKEIRSTGRRNLVVKLDPSTGEFE